MKNIRSIVYFRYVFLVFSILLTLIACESKAGVEVTTSTTGTTTATVRYEITFSPSPKEFDQLIVFDLKKDFVLITKKFKIGINYTTDTGFSKNDSFYFKISKKRLVRPELVKAKSYCLVPRDKKILDNFFEEALKNKKNKVSGTAFIKFNIKPKDPKVKKVVLKPGDFGVREKLAKNEKLKTLPVKIKSKE
jgi:hypothetical protein